MHAYLLSGFWSLFYLLFWCVFPRLFDKLIVITHHVYAVKLLKVRNLSGEWITAPPVPGTFVCNIGDMLKVSYP